MTSSANDLITRIAIAVILLMLATGAVTAQAQPVVLGAGGDSCQTMFEESRVRFKSDRSIARFYQSWMLGFISGMNLANFAAGSARTPVSIKAGELRDWIEKYCIENPDHDVVTATVKLYYERSAVTRP